MRPEEQFHDYTLASQLERFVAAIEQTLVSWQRTGLSEIISRGYRARIREQPSQVKVQASLQHRLPWRREPYVLQLHLPTALGRQQHHGGRLQGAAASGAPGGVAGAGGTDKSAGRQQQQRQGQGNSGAGAAITSGTFGGGPAAPGPRGGEDRALPGDVSGAAGMRPEGRVEGGVLAAGGQRGAAAGQGEGAGQGSGSAAVDVGHGGRGEGGGGSGNGTGGSSRGDLDGAPGWEVGVELDMGDVMQRIGDLVSYDSREGLYGNGGEQDGEVGGVGGAAGEGEAGRTGGGLRGMRSHSLPEGEKELLGESGSEGVEEEEKDVEQEERGRESGPGARESGKDGWDWDEGWDVREEQGAQASEAGKAAQEAAAGSAVGRQQARERQRQQQGQGTEEVPARGADGTAGPAGDSRGEMHAAQPLASSASSAAAVAPASAKGSGQAQAQVQARLGAGAGAGVEAEAAAFGVQPAGRPGALPWWLPTHQHRLQRWLGLDAFLLLHPASFTRRLLDETEAGTLLGAAALALSACGLPLPLLLPVHDGLRDAHWGLAAVPGAGTLHMRADSVHISSPSKALTALRGQLAALGEQLMPLAPRAGTACMALAQGEAAGPCRLPRGVTATWSACFAHRVPYPDARLRARLTRWARAARAARAAAATATTVRRTGAEAAAGGGRGGREEGQAEGAEGEGGRVRSHPLDAWVHRGSGDGADGSPAEHTAHTANTHARGGGGSDGGWEDGEGESEAGSSPGCGAGAGPVRSPGGGGGGGPTDPWDAGSAWQPWAVQLDPVGALELDVAWEGVELRAGEALPQLQACNPGSRWLLHALQVGTGGYAGGFRGLVGLRPRDGARRHVELQRAGADWLWNSAAADAWTRPGGQPPPSVTPITSSSQVGPGSFTVMLSSLLTGRSVTRGSAEVGQLAAADWWEQRGWRVPPLPPAYVMQDVLQDLLNYSAPPPPPPQGGSGGGGGGSGGGADNASPPLSGGRPFSSSPYPRTAPLQGLLSRLALHALLFGNARAVAWLWQRFVRELRFGCWEVDRQLPRMAPHGAAGEAAGAGAAGGALPGDPVPGPWGSGARAGAAGGGGALDADGTSTEADEKADGGVVDGVIERLLVQEARAAAAAGGQRGASGGGRTSYQQHRQGPGQQGEEERLAPPLGVEPPAPDLSSCLLHQKLQVLDVCIYRRKARARIQHLESFVKEQQQQQHQGQQQGQQQQQQQQQQQGRPPTTQSRGVSPVSPDDPGFVIRSRTRAAADRKAAAAATNTAPADPARPHGTDQQQVPNGGRPRARQRSPSPMGSNHNSTGGTAGGAAGGAAGGGLTSLASARSGAESESFYSVGDPWDAGEDSWPEGWEGGQEGEEHEGAKGGGSGAADKGHEGKGEGEGQLLPLAGSGGDGEAAEGGCGGQLAAAARARRPVLRVPVTQAPPLLSEDRMLEQQAAMERLAVHPQGSELAWRLNSVQLASDMAAFKAANPGCSFTDFLSWHSPKDVLGAAAAGTGGEQNDLGGMGDGHEQQQPGVSARMAPTASAHGSGPAAHGGSSAESGVNAGGRGGRGAPAPSNPWHVLWDSTAPCHAWRQKPLQDPSLEGERVLHELDTLPPTVLYDTLLGTALAAAVQLLAASEGGSLPPVAALLRQYVRISAPIIKRGCSLAPSSAHDQPHSSHHDLAPVSTGKATAATPTRSGAGNTHATANGTAGAQVPPAAQATCLVGWEDVELEYLLAEFHYLEQAVVLAESLVRRLPGNRQLAADLMAATLQGAPGLEEGRTVMRPAAWVTDPAARDALACLLAGRCPDPPPGPTRGSGTARGATRGKQGGSDTEGGVGRGQRLAPWSRAGAASSGAGAGLEGSSPPGLAALAAGKLGEGGGGAAGGWEGEDWGAWEDEGERGTGGRGGGRGEGYEAGQLVGKHEVYWEEPCLREWVLEVRQPLGPGAAVARRMGQGGAGAEGRGDDAGSCKHRMYVLAGEGEMRVATALWHSE